MLTNFIIGYTSESIVHILNFSASAKKKKEDLFAIVTRSQLSSVFQAQLDCFLCFFERREDQNFRRQKCDTF